MGLPQYGSPAYDFRFSTATRSRHSTSRGQARHTDTSASSWSTDSAASAIAATCAAVSATAVSGVAGSPGQPEPAGTGESNTLAGAGMGQLHRSTVPAAQNRVADRAAALLDSPRDIP